MPKTNLCKIREDPRKAEVRAVLDAGMAREDMSRKTLAKKAGIAYSTLTFRMRNPETITMGEFWAITDVLKVSHDDRAKTV